MVWKYAKNIKYLAWEKTSLMLSVFGPELRRHLKVLVIKQRLHGCFIVLPIAHISKELFQCLLFFFFSLLSDINELVFRTLYSFSCPLFHCCCFPVCSSVHLALMFGSEKVENCIRCSEKKNQKNPPYQLTSLERNHYILWFYYYLYIKHLS